MLRTEHGLTFSDIVPLADVEDCTLVCVPGGIDQAAAMCEMRNCRRWVAERG